MVWRYILAFALSIGVIAGWQYLFPPPKPAPPAPAQASPAGPGAPATGQPTQGERAQAGRVPEAPPPEEMAPDPNRPVRPHKQVALELTRGQMYAAKQPERVRVKILADSLDGAISGVFLPEFGDKEDRESPYELLDASDAPRHVLGLRLTDHTDIPSNENWEVEEQPEGEAPAVRFRNEIDGLSITKSISGPGREIPSVKEQPSKFPSEGLYHVMVSVAFKNRSDQPKTFSYTLFGPLGIETSATRGGPGTDIYYVAGSWTQQGKKVSPEPAVAAGSVPDRRNVVAPAWVGSVNCYFAGLFFPYRDEPGPSPYVQAGFSNVYPDPVRARELVEEGDSPDGAYKNIYTGFDSRPVTLAPGEEVVHRYAVFVGPRSKEVLKAYSSLQFESVNDYFFLVSFFLSLLSFLKGIAFGSWGLAIVLMTVLVKLCLHPFNKKSQANMHRFQKQMSKVKPEMDALKERYKDNRLKQNQEMQRLFKEKGINPGQQMGGCLLILLQLPIWFALYSTLGYALGLRQAEFLWIEDLTQPDRLFPLGISAFGGMFMHFNILPVLYVIFTIVNQRLQPKPEDPQMRSQYQMMTFMMVFFGFIFYNFPAGFMLYIMTSTFLGIFESKMIKAELAREESEAATPTARSGEHAPGAPMYGGKGGGSAGNGGASGKKKGKRGKGNKGKGRR